MITNYTLSIDEEIWITKSASISAWLSQSRFGLYIFNQLFNPSGTFIPILWDVLAIIFWFVSSTVFVYSISKFHKKSPTAFSIFSFTSVFCTLPFVLGDWMSFSMFNFQQGLALLVMAIAVNYSYIYFETKKISHLVCSTILIYISTSFYQAHIVFYVCSIAIYLFLMIIKEEVLDIKEIYKNILVSIVVFTIAFFSYYITDLFIRNFILNQYNYHGTYLIG